MRHKVLMALQVVGHPRDSKRIEMLSRVGFDLVAVAFSRKFHSGRVPGCHVQIVGEICNGQYFRRLLKMIRSLPEIRKAIKSTDIIYASGPDMALLCLVANLGLRRPLVLEVGDVREIQTKQNIFGSIVRIFDRLLVKACSLIVVTAPDFIDHYYRRWLNVKTPAIVLENKLDISIDDLPTFPKRECESTSLRRPLRIGYFGLLRWKDSLDKLKSLAAAYPEKIEVLVAGYIIDPLDLVEQIEGYPNIEYGGEYCSPADLPKLYGSVDLIWAVYPNSSEDWNLKWARTNRFYESCFFNTPIISRLGCNDAKEISKYDIGLVLKSCEMIDILDIFKDIEWSDLSRWMANMNGLAPEVYIYTNEYEELETAVRGVIE